MLLTTSAKVNAVKSLMREKKYSEALEIAEKINPEKVTSLYDLSAIAEVYMRKGRMQEAHDLYVEMYGRNKTHKVMTGLIEICLKMKEPKEAEGYLREFRQMEPNNPERLIYRYRVDCMLGKGPEYLIKSLAKLKNEEYTDVWALELAKAYYNNNDRESCARECHQILKYFPDAEAAKKAKILLDACEVREEPEAPASVAVTEEKVDTTEMAQVLQDDVTAMLEENAAAEAVANEVVDEKAIAKASAPHPEPYLRTIEFTAIHKPAGEDRSLYGAETKAAVETEEAPKGAHSDFVLPEELVGKIDRVCFDDDDDDDDDESYVILCGESEKTVETEATADDDDDVELVIEEAIGDAEAAAEEAVSETEEIVEEAAEEENEETSADEAEDVAEESTEEIAENSEETAEASEETEEVEEEVEEAEESEEVTEEADETEEEAEEVADSEEEPEVTEEQDEEAFSEESDELHEDDEYYEDDLEFAEDDDSDEDEEDDESEEEESEDDDELDEDVDDESESDEDDDDVLLYGAVPEEDDAAEEDEDSDDDEDEEEDDDDDVIVPKVGVDEDAINEELDSVAEKLASQICSAAEADRGSLYEESDDPDRLLGDTQVIEKETQKAVADASKDFDDAAIERALYNLLGEDKDKKN